MAAKTARDIMTPECLTGREFFMAGPEGLEPSTYGFGDRRSTN